MLKALIYGIIAGGALVLGAFIGLHLPLKKKLVANIMAFGSGVLICALTFGLMDEAYKNSGFGPVTFGFLVGGVLFILGDRLIARYGGHHRKGAAHAARSKSQAEATGLAIALGAALDGIPESIALGVSILAHQTLGVLMLTALFLSNFPEGIAGIPGLKKAGKSKFYILCLWGIIGILCATATFWGYKISRNISLDFIAIILASAAGAILAMVADTMIPEAYNEGGEWVAFSTLIGFLVAFVISRMGL